MESIQQTTILGIDPGTRFMGLAVIRGDHLVHFAVRTLRNGKRPYDLLGQARQHTLAAIRDFQPRTVAIEEPLLLPSKRAAMISAIAQELHERSRELGTLVLEVKPYRTREVLVGNSRATKIDVAEALVRRGFRELAPLVPKRPARAALGIDDRDRYWLHAFDAVALALAAQSLQATAVSTNN